jgi:hypothetical protein
MLESGFWNCDCMDAMREFPDKFFDLSIVDRRTQSTVSRTEKQADLGNTVS